MENHLLIPSFSTEFFSTESWDMNRAIGKCRNRYDQSVPPLDCWLDKEVSTYGLKFHTGFTNSENT